MLLVPRGNRCREAVDTFNFCLLFPVSKGEAILYMFTGTFNFCLLFHDDLGHIAIGRRERPFNFCLLFPRDRVVAGRRDNNFQFLFIVSPGRYDGGTDKDVIAFNFCLLFLQLAQERLNTPCSILSIFVYCFGVGDARFIEYYFSFQFLFIVSFHHAMALSSIFFMSFQFLFIVSSTG